MRAAPAQEPPCRPSPPRGGPCGGSPSSWSPSPSSRPWPRSSRPPAQHVPPGEAVFFRSFFAAPVILLWLLWRGDFPRALATQDPLGHFWRAFVGAIAHGPRLCGPGPPVPAGGDRHQLCEPAPRGRLRRDVPGRARPRRPPYGGGPWASWVSSWCSRPRLSVGAEPASDGETLGRGGDAGRAGLSPAPGAGLRAPPDDDEGTAAIVWWFSVNSRHGARHAASAGWRPLRARRALLVGAGLLGGLGQILLTSAYATQKTGLSRPSHYGVHASFAVLIAMRSSRSPDAATLGRPAADIIAAGS
jgi:hypothetical protein